MKIKIDDLFLNNSYPHSVNLERRVTVTIPYDNKFYLLISEMNLNFKQNNPRLFGIQVNTDAGADSDETKFEKSYDSVSDLFMNMQDDIVHYLSQVKQEDWISFCVNMYSKYEKEFTVEQKEKQLSRFVNFNYATIEAFKNLNSETFILGQDQDLREWNVFWKHSQMQTLSKRLNYKETIKVKLRKI